MSPNDFEMIDWNRPALLAEAVDVSGVLQDVVYENGRFDYADRVNDGYDEPLTEDVFKSLVDWWAVKDNLLELGVAEDYLCFVG